VQWKVWAAVAAIVIGFLIPTLAGGSLPPHAIPILVALALVGVAATALQRGHERTTTLTEQRPTQTDRELPDEIGRLIHSRDVEWLRREDFAGSWPIGHCSRLREAALLDAGHTQISDPELGRAVCQFADAAGIFVDIHDSSTIPDPIMRDPTWATIGYLGPDGGPGIVTDEDRQLLKAQLRRAADDVCTAIDVLQLTLGSLVSST
jgi:hypothetical protein